MTGFLNPYYCFGILGVLGISVVITALSIDTHLEVESDIEAELAMQVDGVNLGRRRTFCEELSHNWQIVKNEFKLPLYQRIILFYVLYGLTVPNFSEYLYYYKLNVAMLS